MAPAARCRSPTTSLIVPTAAATIDRVEDERRQLARADPSRDHVVAADPQDDADGAEHQHDHRGDQQRALADPVHRGPERRLDALAEVAPVDGLVAVGLHGADLVQRLVDVRADVADAVLARARELAHARPNRMIGTITTGTPASTSSVSLVLVSASIARPPTSSSRLRIAIDALEPMTVSSIVVSLVRREITSPVRVTSKNPGGSVSRWSNTARRRSAVTRSPIHDTK